MRRITLLIAVALAVTGFAPPAFAQNGACDRACLETTVDQFLDALVKHDPKLVPLTRTVKFTENGQKLPVGDGSWRTMVGKGTYRLFVSDPKAEQVAFIGTLLVVLLRLASDSMVSIPAVAMGVGAFAAQRFGKVNTLWIVLVGALVSVVAFRT